MSLFVHVPKSSSFEFKTYRSWQNPHAETASTRTVEMEATVLVIEFLPHGWALKEGLVNQERCF